MLERIRKEELGSSILKIVLIVILGFVLIGISGIHKIIIGPTPLTHLDQNKLEGEFITYDMWLSFDSFAEMIYTVDGQETSEFQDFLIPVEEYYMAVRIYPLHYEKMARFVEDSFAWMDYETDELPDVFKIDGVIEKMDSEELSYYYDYIGLTESEAEQYGYLPYIIDTSRVFGAGNLSFTVLMVIIGIVMIGVAIWKVYAIQSSRHHLDLVTLIQQDPDIEIELEKWIQEEKSYRGLRVNEKWFFYHTHKRTIILPSSDVLWMHTHVTQHRVNFIPVGNSYVLKIWTRQGKCIEIPVLFEKDSNDMILYTFERIPHLITGYSEELEKLYSKDREAFMHLKDN